MMCHTQNGFNPRICSTTFCWTFALTCQGFENLYHIAFKSNNTQRYFAIIAWSIKLGTPSHIHILCREI
ncbi:hypothetical protein M408DRAFT_221527 [Serendipita vermifera MAFF 305830]|uniref:Uncharacterized protein n=1 Tax=Serendipita vermifera MAFF 305830 TaxID=933852 RepID=A0A0C3AKW0_SERVB|nr:hypothetical protein M408DRAFT_221527 [Serendipita vermifera MAFF 305830]